MNERTPCRMNGNTCPNDAADVVRVDTVGDRPLCGPHRDFVIGQGFGRVLPLEPAFVPQWRQNLKGRDQTGLVLAR